MPQLAASIRTEAHHMTATPINFSEMQVVPVAAQATAIVRTEVLPSEMPGAQRRARSLLANALKDAGVDTPAQAFTMWRSGSHGKIDYAPGVFVPNPMKAAADVSLYTLPDGRAAYVKLTGSYAALPAAWQHLFASCKAQNWNSPALTGKSTPKRKRDRARRKPISTPCLPDNMIPATSLRA
jgi:effector-binding domain-containing protein